MKNAKTYKTGPILQLNFIIASNRTICYWCGQSLMPCGMCKGSGLFRGSDCQCCNGSMRLCKNHDGNWER